jgi:hypothetical protein
MLPKVCLHVIGFEFIKLVDINRTLFLEITPCSLELGTNSLLEEGDDMFFRKTVSSLPDYQSHWPRDLKRGSAAARLLGLRV